MKTEDNGKSRDPFLCTCGPCKRFWRSTFGPEAGRLKRSPVCKSNSLTSNQADRSPYLPLGGRVVVKDKHPGTIRYVGYLDTPSNSSPKLYVGVKLDDNVNSTHNGIYKGKRYFFCPKGHGAMVNPSHIRPASAPNKTPALHGNFMFPSYDVIRQRRKERQEQLCSLDTASSCSSTVSTSKTLQQCVGLDRQRSAALRLTSDHKDMMYQDRQRDLERVQRHQAQQMLISENRSRKREPPSQLQKWKAKFGGDEQAARMAETLQKLHLAYEEGRKLVEGETTTDDK